MNIKKTTYSALLFASTMSLLFSLSLFASDLVQMEALKTHLRLNIFIPENQVVVSKVGSQVSLSTLDRTLYEKLKADLLPLVAKTKYITALNEKRDSAATNASQILLVLADPTVEIFQFYRKTDNKLVIDFWSDSNLSEKSDSKVATASLPVDVEKKSVEVKVPTLTTEKKPTPIAIKPSSANKKEATVASSVNAKTAIEKNKKDQKVEAPVEPHMISPDTVLYPYRAQGMRDFRYGAAFIWDYDPILPEVSKIISLESKTPEIFYPIENRAYDKSEKEAHLQLMINLYKKKKYGLMYKAMTLFQKKYGANTDADFIDYLKVNALIRENMNKGDRQVTKSVINMLNAILDKTTSYGLKQGVLKYLVAFYRANNEDIMTLKMAQKLYVTSKENFEVEDTTYAVEMIFSSFAVLGQSAKITELANDPQVKKILPIQTLISYQMYADMKNANVENVLKLYEKHKASLVKPVHSTILYNVGEAYFRKGNYQEAIKLYDDFLTNYSAYTVSEKVRLRLALSYDLIDRDPAMILALYDSAINHSTSVDVRTEAKIRYVGLRLLRKMEPAKADYEYITYLENSDKNIKLGKELGKLLWLVRLRTYIIEKKYNEAITYLTAIPLYSMKPSEIRVFEGDGAEVVYGLILNAYTNSDYAKAIRLWESFQQRYIQKVAFDPYLNYLAAYSYLKMKMYSGFERSFNGFQFSNEKVARTYPEWSTRTNLAGGPVLLSELALLKDVHLKNSESAEAHFNALKKMAPKHPRLDYYQAILAYYKGNYLQAANSYESYLASTDKKTLLDLTEIADLLADYTDSLMKLEQYDKFLTVVDALLKDITDEYMKHEYMRRSLERLSYLSIELVSKRPGALGMKLEDKAREFKQRFSKSSYEGRIDYLLGMFLINNERGSEGVEVLKALVNKESTASYIKEMAKSEIALQKIKDKTL